jgi:ribosomal protein S17E
MYWLIGRNSKLSLENKILLYKTIIKPIRTYGVEIWGCASKSNISIIQRSQSKVLRMIANAPWYFPNIILHEDLNVPLVKEVIKQRSKIYHNKIQGHVNFLIQLLHNQRRLKRNWPADL